MSNESSTIIQKLWNYCHVLRDDGVSYGDYVEQLTYLIFLKMADERDTELKESSQIPGEFGWKSLINKDGEDLEIHYRRVLGSLGKKKGMLKVIFKKAQSKIQHAAKLKRLISLIDEVTWSEMKADVKSEIYEGLLDKNAQDVKSGAGQYFTPRELIKSVVEVMRPELGMTIYDPACGTGGFLIAAHSYLSKLNPDKEQQRFLKYKALKGKDIVDNVVRLCVMNLYLHGIGGDESLIETGDSLAKLPSDRYDMVLTNPPFGKKSSITITNGESKADKDPLIYERDDFWATTSNKQLNFLQHVKSILKTNGKAVIVVPDNVLFEGGAGETIRRKLLHGCDVHTLLRLPTGIFYAQGVKANVLFFDRKPEGEKPWTQKLWIYDLRTNKHFTLKTNPLKEDDLKDFIKCYNSENRFDRKETERFKLFTYDELIQRDKVSLDIFWLKDESLEDTDNLPEPDILALEITENLESALEQFRSIYEDLGSE